MVTNILTALLVLGSGTVAGVMFAVAVSTLPALLSMPPDQYVDAHRALGRNWDPTMPIIVLSSTIIATVLAFLVSAPVPRTMFAVSAALLLGVAGVSHLCNVPINRAVKALDSRDIPADWPDPRPLWRRWHLLRTGFAVTALTVVGLTVAFT
ncbi:DUF1772 domain-containing protein [Actinoallomurus liliacearum]|uniref:DUF1772 domain-containing protein n=1 Tax=Actinoallomurus liliacearum TaxID=1080073 RepID=A0ABP8TQG6_9ACTN